MTGMKRGCGTRILIGLLKLKPVPRDSARTNKREKKDVRFHQKWKKGEKQLVCPDTRRGNELVRSVTFLSDIDQSNHAKVVVRLENKSRIFGTIVFFFRTFVQMNKPFHPMLFIPNSDMLFPYSCGNPIL